MKRAKFQAEDEHSGVFNRSYDVVRGLERIDGCVAAHESDHGALYRRIELQVCDHVEIEARRIKPGARGDQDVGDGAALLLAEVELVERASRQPRSVALECLHAAGGWG